MTQDSRGFQARYGGFRAWTETSSFRLFSLACALVAAFTLPLLLWIPLVIGFVPWILRVAAGRLPFRRTPLDLAVGLYFLAIIVGTWAAYHTPVAVFQFRFHVAAILLYYAIAALAARDLWVVAGVFGFFSVVLAGFDLLTHDWTAFPAKVGVLQRVGQTWMQVRPRLPLNYAHPNVISGLSGVTLPFAMALSVRAWQRKRIVAAVLWSLGCLLVLVMILLSTTRGVWLGLLVAASSVLLLVVWPRLDQRITIGPAGRRAVLAVAAVAMLIVVALLVAGQDVIAQQLNSLPRTSSLRLRVDQVQALTELIQDFPLTGSGLHTFPGLYSYYIRFTPEFIWPHGHNTYLDIFLELGPLGFGALAWMFLAALWWLFKPLHQGPEPLLRLAALASLCIMATHALVADNIFHTNMASLLLVIPGMAVALERARRLAMSQEAKALQQASAGRKRFVLLAGFLVVVLLLALNLVPAVRSLWQSNLGAIQAARVELARWGSGDWDPDVNLQALVPPERRFQRALELNPRNSTAHHRLGLIALQRKDFPEAVAHLEAARDLDSNHWGITKALAFAYAWTGAYDRAASLMQKNPDSEEELVAYASWWRSQEREDLAAHAEAMRQYLQRASP